MPDWAQNTWRSETSRDTWGRKLLFWLNHNERGPDNCTALSPANHYPFPAHLLLWTSKITRFRLPFTPLAYICKVVACSLLRSFQKFPWLVSNIFCWEGSEDFKESKNMQKAMSLTKLMQIGRSYTSMWGYIVAQLRTWAFLPRPLSTY